MRVAPSLLAAMALSFASVPLVFAQEEIMPIDIPPPPPMMEEMAPTPRTQYVSVNTLLEAQPDIIVSDGSCALPDMYDTYASARKAMMGIRDSIQQAFRGVLSSDKIAFRVKAYNAYPTTLEAKTTYNGSMDISVRILDTKKSADIDRILVENGCNFYSWSTLFRKTSALKRAAIKELLPVAREEAAMYGEIYNARFSKITSIDVQVDTGMYGYQPASYDPATNTAFVNATLNVTFEEQLPQTGK